MFTIPGFDFSLFPILRPSDRFADVVWDGTDWQLIVRPPTPSGFKEELRPIKYKQNVSGAPHAEPFILKSQLVEFEAAMGRARQAFALEIAQG